MTNQELEKLFMASTQRFDQLVAKYRLGLGLTRRECDELRHCTQRIGMVAYEAWVSAGKPNDPEFDGLHEPPKLSPLPASMRPLNLLGDMEVH